MSSASKKDPDVTLEGTLALIKPNVSHKESQIMELVREKGFLVVERSKFTFSDSMARRFYAPQKHRSYFEDLISYMTSGETVALCLAREDGIRAWKEALGPKRVSQAMKEAPNSLRARYGNPRADIENGLHASDSPEESEREIEIVFPHILHGGDSREGSPTGSVSDKLEETVSGIPRDNKQYLERFVTPTLLRGLSEMYETRPESPVSWLADWLTDNNPYRE